MSARRMVVSLDDLAPRRFEFIESFFSLPMAVAYRTIFLTELWRLAVVPRLSEKKHWLNTSTVNNETIEMQMQMLPVIGLDSLTQKQLLETYSSFPASQSAEFVQAWAHTLHRLALDHAVLVEAQNHSTTDYLSVTSEHCRVVDADKGQPNEEFTSRAFASQGLPNVASIVPGIDMSEPAFVHMFLLGPKYNDLSSAPRDSEVKLLTRFLPVRGRENACFNLFCNIFYESPTMTEDADAAAAAESGAPALSPADRRLQFTMEPAWPIYTWRFLWFGATRIFLMRLYYLLAKFQTGQASFDISSSIVTATGARVFEAKFGSGTLELPWEKEMREKREQMFESTDGLPLAFSKREISAGYADFAFYNFLAEFILDTQYGKTISRSTAFDRFDQEDTILRLEFIHNHPPKTVKDANDFYIEQIEQAILFVERFFQSYQNSF